MKTNIPALRFPGFEGEWERKRLLEASHINPTCKKLPDEFIYIDLESVEKGMLKKRERLLLQNAPSRAQRYLQDDDILFQTVRPYQKNNFYFSKGEGYVASTGYAQLRTNHNARFLYQLLHTEKFVRKVLLRCTGTSYPAINSNDLAKIPINLPTLPEQQKIADFLTAVDDKIKRLTRKKTLLEQYKKGVMQKIFSQEIRFKDDEGKEFPVWEVKTLGKVTENIASGKTKPTDKGIYNVYGSTGIIGSFDEYTHNGRYILIARVGANAGTINLVNEKFCVTDNTLVLSCGNDLNVAYIFFLLLNKNLNKLVFGSGQPLITGGQLKALKCEFPTLPEQQKIAQFLTAIDQKIAHVTTLLETTKKWKGGLLQQLFV